MQHETHTPFTSALSYDPNGKFAFQLKAGKTTMRGSGKGRAVIFLVPTSNPVDDMIFMRVPYKNCARWWAAR